MTKAFLTALLLGFGAYNLQGCEDGNEKGGKADAVATDATGDVGNCTCSCHPAAGAHTAKEKADGSGTHCSSDTAEDAACCGAATTDATGDSAAACDCSCHPAAGAHTAKEKNDGSGTHCSSDTAEDAACCSR